MDWNSPTTKKHITEAKAQGCELMGAGKNSQSRLYRLDCLHEQSVAFGDMRDGQFMCLACLADKHDAEAEAQECVLLGKGR